MSPVFSACSLLGLVACLDFRRWPTAALLVLISGALVGGAVTNSNAANTVLIQDDASIEFASKEVAGTVLTNKDGFIRRMSGIDRQLRLRSDSQVAEEPYLQYVREQVAEWSPEEIEKLTGVIEGIREKLKPISATWPKQIQLIKTTGLEESGAAYCREAAIVLPQSIVNGGPQSLERILLHELFHVLSSHSPELRSQLYEIVGFTVCPDIALPDRLKHRKITNPDAPAINCVMTLSDGDQQTTVTPVLLSLREKYETIENRTLFSELMFRLMVVEQRDGMWHAKLSDQGEPQLLRPASQPSFRKQIGRNTNYIIHPEEVLADNFVHLVMKSKELPDAWIVEGMREHLEQ